MTLTALSHTPDRIPDPDPNLVNVQVNEEYLPYAGIPLRSARCNRQVVEYAPP